MLSLDLGKGRGKWTYHVFGNCMVLRVVTATCILLSLPFGITMDDWKAFPSRQNNFPPLATLCHTHILSLSFLSQSDRCKAKHLRGCRPPRLCLTLSCRPQGSSFLPSLSCFPLSLSRTRTGAIIFGIGWKNCLFLKSFQRHFHAQLMYFRFSCQKLEKAKILITPRIYCSWIIHLYHLDLLKIQEAFN